MEEYEAEKCPNSDKEHAKNILGLRKGEEFLIWILHKIMEIICFAANFLQCNTTFSAVHVQVCFKSFCLLL